MKTISKTILAIACLALTASCSDSKKSPSGDQVEEAIEQVKQEFKDMSNPDKFKTALESFKLKVSDVEPGFAYQKEDEKGRSYMSGMMDDFDQIASAAYVKEDKGEISIDEYEAFLTKVYNATAKVADGGKNVEGFHDEFKTKEQAMTEKPIEKVTGNIKNWSMVGWAFPIDGIFYEVDCNLKEPGLSSKIWCITLKVAKGQQKSLGEIIEEGEKALEDENVQKALDEIEKKMKE